MRVSLIVFLFSSVALAKSDDQSAYFKLHQATAYQELGLYNKCPGADIKIKKLIDSINLKKISPVIASKIEQFEKSFPFAAPEDFIDIESYRLSIHEMQTKLNLKHNDIWHEEVEKDCEKKKSNYCKLYDCFDPSSINQEASITPVHNTDGTIQGFNFTSIKKDSVYDKLGFQVNDVILECDGKPLNDAAIAMSCFDKSKKTIKFKYSRNKKVDEKTLSFK